MKQGYNELMRSVFRETGHPSNPVGCANNAVHEMRKQHNGEPVDWPAVCYALLWAAYLVDHYHNKGEKSWLEVDRLGVGGPLLEIIQKTEPEEEE